MIPAEIYGDRMAVNYYIADKPIKSGIQAFRKFWEDELFRNLLKTIRLLPGNRRQNRQQDLAEEIAEISVRLFLRPLMRLLIRPSQTSGYGQPRRYILAKVFD